MKKRYIAFIVSLMLIGVTVSLYQYVKVMQLETANATQTIPSPGHSWSEMESGPDSIQVSGRTITNLTAPVNATDATNKDYVDAAGGGGLYSTCYMVNKTTSGTTCGTGYTTLIKINQPTGGWVFDASVPSSDGGVFFVTLGSGILQISAAMTDSSSYLYFNESANTWEWGGTGQYVGGVGYATITINGVQYSRNVCEGSFSGLVFLPNSFALCCQ